MSTEDVGAIVAGILTLSVILTFIPESKRAWERGEKLIPACGFLISLILIVSWIVIVINQFD